MKTVITYGTFDLFHFGHYSILKRAKELGDYLIVGVTSESYDIDRGKLTVHNSLVKRIEDVQRTGFADKIIVEEYLGQKVRDIVKYNVDVLVVGSDWVGKFDHLKKYCDVVYLDRTKNISSTKLREEMSSINNIGIITDDIDDAGFVVETKYVSGIHAENVYSADPAIAEEFCRKYELSQHSSSLDEFLNSIGIVYIKSALENRYDYIMKALLKGKHVICDFPFSSDYKKCEELHEIAEKQHVILLESIVTIYLRAFTQLLWMLQSNTIGSIVGLDALISADVFGSAKSFDELSVFPVCAAIKTLGSDYKAVHKNLVRNDDGEVVYGTIFLQYEKITAHLQIGTKTNLRNKMTIIGDKASVCLYDDWWNTGYFKIIPNSGKGPERFSSNFEGTGLRYLFQELLLMIGDNRTQCNRLFPDEVKAIIDVLDA